MCPEKSFFYITGYISIHVVHMTRANSTFHTLSKQEFGSVMVAEDIQLNVQTPSPMHLCSGKHPLPISNLDFHNNGGKQTNGLPLAL